MHKVLVNRLGGLSLPRKSVVRLTDRPDMTLGVYRGRKTTIQQYNDIHYNSKIRYNVNLVCTKISGSCISFIDILQQNIRFVFLLESHLGGAILTKTQKV